ADPVPLPRRAPAQPLPERSRLHRRPPEACAGGIQAAVRPDGTKRDARSRLGADPRRPARSEAVPAGGAAQERMAGGRARPADERRGLLREDDSPQARRATPDLVAAPAAVQRPAARQVGAMSYCELD